MNTDRKTLEQVAVDDRNEFDDRSSLGDVLIVSGDETIAFIGRLLPRMVIRSSRDWKGSGTI